MTQATWTIKELLRVSADYLKQKGVENPRLSAEVLLAHRLKTDRLGLYLDFERPLHEDEIEGFRSLVRRRAGREPLQYIRGHQEFWSADFLVRKGVLIPRPESELLVEQTLRILRDRPAEGPQPHILDLCTGSGAIIISLGREIEKGFLHASDLSEEALEVARENARRYGLEQRIEFLQGSLFEPVKAKGLVFDIVVSNPPYIATDDLESLMPEVRHEPRLALDGGPGGMVYIEQIIRDAADCLLPQGWLLIEMDPEQVQPAMVLIDRAGRYRDKSAIRDYSSRYRVVMAQRN